MPETTSFTVELEQGDGFDFRIRFDWPGVADVLADEPEPLGHRHGPNAARLLVAAVGNCLAASLVFCLKTKFKDGLGPVRAQATGTIERNARGRYRVGGIEVAIRLSEAAGSLPHFDRCAAQFEDFCIVTESVRKGIPVSVSVVDATGRTVHQGAAAAP